MTDLKAAALTAFMIASSSCVEDAGLCVEGFEEDSLYRVTIVDDYNNWPSDARWESVPDNTSPECAFILPPMASFDIRTVDTTEHRPGGCESWTASIENFPLADAIGQRGNASPPSWGGTIAAWGQVIEFDGCTAFWKFSLVVPDHGDPFRQASRSSPPPVLLERVVDSGSTGCPAAGVQCVDLLAVSIKGLE